MSPDNPIASDVAESFLRSDRHEESDAELTGILARVPPFIRPPKARQRCPYSGLSRTSFEELISPCERNGFNPPVRAVYRRARKFATRGIWLVYSESLFKYLLGLRDQSATSFLEAKQLRKMREDVK